MFKYLSEKHEYGTFVDEDGQQFMIVMVINFIETSCQDGSVMRYERSKEFYIDDGDKKIYAYHLSSDRFRLLTGKVLTRISQI